jgi:hypothetical protein
MQQDNGIHYISKNVCKKIIKKLGDKAPQNAFVYNVTATKGIAYNGNMAKTDPGSHKMFTPAYTVNELLMPKGIFDALMDKKLEDEKTEFVEKTSTLCNIFTTIWHEGSWKEAEKYLESLLA